MNPVFWFLVVVAAVILWFAISFIFIPLGRRVGKKMKKISDIFEYEETERKEENEQKEKEAE